MRTHNATIAVRIDKQKQNEKRENTGGFLLDPRFIAMKRNLQYGTVVEIGDQVAKHSPEIQVGDIACFHHYVEDNKYTLLETLDNGDEIRIAYPVPHDVDHSHSSQLYAIVKPTGEVIPYDSYVFLNNVFEPLEKQTDYNGFMVSETDSLDTELVLKQQNDATGYRKSLEMTFKNSKNLAQREAIYAELNSIVAQQDELAETANKIRRVIGKVVKVGNKSNAMGINAGSKVVVDKEILYPINIMGQSYLIVRNIFIDGIVRE
jgi:hypothetical protein